MEVGRRGDPLCRRTSCRCVSGCSSCWSHSHTWPCCRTTCWSRSSCSCPRRASPHSSVPATTLSLSSTHMACGPPTHCGCPTPATATTPASNARSGTDAAMCRSAAGTISRSARRCRTDQATGCAATPPTGTPPAVMWVSTTTAGCQCSTALMCRSTGGTNKTTEAAPIMLQQVRAASPAAHMPPHMKVVTPQCEAGSVPTTTLPTLRCVPGSSVCFSRWRDDTFSSSLL